MHPAGKRRKPVVYVDVYIDDFVGVAQGAWAQNRVHRTLFHALNQVFRPGPASGHEETSPGVQRVRQEPASTKKMKKGDAAWATSKTVLGWEFDTKQETISLPSRRLQRLHDILADLPRTKRRIATKKWHKIIGELRSMSLAVPGLRGHFSLLQEAFRHETRQQIRLSPALHAFFGRFSLACLHISIAPHQVP